jgi:hypothetical protein
MKKEVTRMSDFCPELWQEDPTPKRYLDCNECGLSKHGTRMVWGGKGTLMPPSWFFSIIRELGKTMRGTIHQVSGYQTAVAYHPLAVRRRPNLWGLFLKDWSLVGW